MDHQTVDKVTQLDVDASTRSDLTATYYRLDSDERQRVDDLIERRGADGARLVGDLDSNTASDLLSCSGTSSAASTDCLDTEFLDRVTQANSNVEDFNAESFARKYNDVDGDNQDLFRELTKNDDVSESWIKTVQAAEIDSENVKIALKHAADLKENGHKPLEFHRSNKLNDVFNGKPPHEDNAIVSDFDIHGEKELYRVHDDSADIGGRWTIEQKVLKESETRSELIDKMALLPEEWEVDYTRVSKLDTSKVQMDAKLRVSRAGKMTSDETGEVRSGGVKQYKIQHPQGKEVENGWSSDGELAQYVDIGGD